MSEVAEFVNIVLDRHATEAPSSDVRKELVKAAEAAAVASGKPWPSCRSAASETVYAWIRGEAVITIEPEVEDDEGEDETLEQFEDGPDGGSGEAGGPSEVFSPEGEGE